jgi:hypothetical protein
VLEGLERAGDGGATLDLGAQLHEGELDGRERGGDVEHVVVADVADTEDLALELALARGERDAVAVSQQEHELVRVNAVGRAGGGDHRGAVVVGRGKLEAHRLQSLAAGAAEAHVALEGGLEALLEQHPERDVQPRDERDRRRDRGVEGRLALARALPVPVEARRGG